MLTAGHEGRSPSRGRHALRGQPQGGRARWASRRPRSVPRSAADNSSEPGTGSPANQLHDYNGGIQPSSLFWVVELPDDAFKVSHDGRRATLEAENVCVLDSFQFGGPTNVPASVSFKVRWEATGRPERRGRGGEVPPTDPAAFLGRFAAARSTGSFSGFEVGFSFKGRGDTDRGYAQLGPERNGTFLS